MRPLVLLALLACDVTRWSGVPPSEPCADCETDTDIDTDSDSDTDTDTDTDTDADGDIDGDSDGVVASEDCDDADPAVHPGASEICNGIDDDCDGDVDDADNDLADGTPYYQDADEDGWGADAWVREACTAPTGFVAEGGDCDDADDTSWPGAPEVCDDGVDHDCDLAIDCADTDCAADAACTCADVVLSPVVPQTIYDDTTGAGDDLVSGCRSSTAPDLVFEWAPPVAGTYTIDTDGSAYDTVLFVLDGCGGTELACNDDDSGLGLQSLVQVTLASTQPILIVVDGYSSSSGSVTLNIY